MSTPQQYRAEAARCAEMAKAAGNPRHMREFQDLERSFSTLARNEQWLADNYDHTVHAGDGGRSVQAGQGGDRAVGVRADLTDDEVHVVQCLGAALVMQWNTLPTTLQRELADKAGAVGENVDTIALRELLAALLPRNADAENERLGASVTASEASQDVAALARWKDEGGAPATPEMGG